jgi:hypothetical protein
MPRGFQTLIAQSRVSQQLPAETWDIAWKGNSFHFIDNRYRHMPRRDPSHYAANDMTALTRSITCFLRR